METDRSRGLRVVKEKSCHRLSHIPTQLVPTVSLGENAFRQAFRHEAAIRFLGHFKDDLRHRQSLYHPGRGNNAGMEATLQSLNTESTEDLSDLCVKVFLATEDTEKLSNSPRMRKSISRKGAKS